MIADEISRTLMCSASLHFTPTNGGPIGTKFAEFVVVVVSRAKCIQSPKVLCEVLGAWAYLVKYTGLAHMFNNPCQGTDLKTKLTLPDHNFGLGVTGTGQGYGLHPQHPILGAGPAPHGFGLPWRLGGRLPNLGSAGVETRDPAPPPRDPIRSLFP